VHLFYRQWQLEYFADGSNFKGLTGGHFEMIGDDIKLQRDWLLHD